jgi:hypothetical protein
MQWRALTYFGAALTLGAGAAHAQVSIDPAHAFCWGENAGWINWASAPQGVQTAGIGPTYLHGHVWGETLGWISLGLGPANGLAYANVSGDDYGGNYDAAGGALSGMAWSENAGWINFSGGALASPPVAARLDTNAGRFFGYVWGENIGWVNLDDDQLYVGIVGMCGTADFDGDGDTGTDADIEAFFACLAGNCCASCFVGGSDFNGDGDIGTDADIESFFRVLAGMPC